MKLFLRILFYLSFVFLFVYLYSKDLLIIPQFRQPILFSLSLGLVFFGFILDTKAWQTIVKKEIPEVSFKISFISNGKFIFTKYIPGKIWILLGKAAYLKEKHNKSLVNLTSFSFYYQLISLLAASISSIVVVYFIHKKVFWMIAIFALLAIVFLTILYRPTLRIISTVLSRVFKKKIELPESSKSLTFKVLFISICNWVVWSFAFYLFLKSILPPESTSVSMGLLFPVSSLIGIVVLLAPGGIGIREGILVIGLTYLGVALQEATAAAFISRLWFLIGEFLFFSSATILELVSNPKSKPGNVTS